MDPLVDESLGLYVGDDVAGGALAGVPLLRDDDAQLLGLGVEKLQD